MNENGRLLGLFIVDKPELNNGVESEVGVEVWYRFLVITPMYEEQGQPWHCGEEGEFKRPGEAEPYALVVDGSLVSVK